MRLYDEAGGCDPNKVRVLKMYRTEIFLKDLQHVKQFVSMTGKYDNLKINLISDIYTIDAHSLIGIISLDITNPIMLELPDSDAPENFIEDLKPYMYTPRVG